MRGKLYRVQWGDMQFETLDGSIERIYMMSKPLPQSKVHLRPKYGMWYVYTVAHCSVCETKTRSNEEWMKEPNAKLNRFFFHTHTFSKKSTCELIFCLQIFLFLEIRLKRRKIIFQILYIKYFSFVHPWEKKTLFCLIPATATTRHDEKSITPRLRNRWFVRGHNVFGYCFSAGVQFVGLRQSQSHPSHLAAQCTYVYPCVCVCYATVDKLYIYMWHFAF